MKKKTKPIDFGADEKKPERDKATRLRDLAREQVRREKAVLELQQKLEEATKKLNEIKEGELPDLMDELGFPEIALGNGYRLVVDMEYKISVPKDNQVAVANWFEKLGYGHDVRREFVISFNKEEEEWAKKFQSDLKRRKKKLRTSVVKTVPSATVRSRVIKLLEAGIEVSSAVSVFKRRVSKVIQPKK